VRFLEGGSIRKTLSGLVNFPTGRQTTFQVDMANVGTKDYADKRTVSNWRFGPVNYEVPLQKSETDDTELTSVDIERDKMYTITVSGNHNQGTLKAWIDDGVKIDVSDFNF
jgi:hypothetical protein